MLKRILILVSGLVFPLGLDAATEFENGLVPVELARDSNITGGNFYKTLPDNFPLVPLPADTGLSVLGSVARPGSEFVLLRNSRSGAEALAMLATAYTAAGWINLAGAPRVTLCHDQHGIMEVLSSDAIPGEHRVYVYRSFYPFGGSLTGMSCAQHLAYNQSGGPMAAVNFIKTLMPTFDMPGSAVALPNGPSGLRISSFSLSGPGRNFEATENYAIEVPDIIMPELRVHFAQQLEAQGWKLDSNGVGEFSASSIGFKVVQAPATALSPAAEVELTGYLTLLNIEDDSYRVQFKLQAGEGASSGLIGIVPINSPSLGIRGIPSGYVPAAILGIPAGSAPDIKGISE